MGFSDDGNVERHITGKKKKPVTEKKGTETRIIHLPSFLLTN